MDDEDTVRVRGALPESDYEDLKDKFPASAALSDSALLRAMKERLDRLEELEDMRATGSRSGREPDPNTDSGSE